MGVENVWAASSLRITCARTPYRYLTYYFHLRGYSSKKIRQKVRVGCCCAKDGV